MDVRTLAGAFSWNELLAANVEEAKLFYTRLFGWTAEESEMTDGGAYTLFKVNGDAVGGLWQLPAEAQQQGARPYWGAYVTVDDVDETMRKARDLGASVIVEPMDIPGTGRFATIQDPQGAIISFIKYE